jgi:hypothetical protein
LTRNLVLPLRALDGDEEADAVEGTMQEVALGNLLIGALEARGEKVEA